MATKNTATKNAKEQPVEQTVSSAEEFLNNYKNTLLYTIAAIVVVGAVIFCYQRFVVQPKKAEAAEQAYPAEALFRQAEYDKALNGDGNTLGFAQIIEDYGSKAGKAMYFYAGVCELQLGNYESAISYLTKYNGKDDILAARALACIGDAYVGLGNNEKALSYFDSAAKKADNMFAAAYLLKAGVVCEELGKPEQAVAYYKEIKDKYPQSIEGYDIDKYITRIEVK